MGVLALLAIGAIETLLGQLPITRRRRSAVIVLSTLGRGSVDCGISLPLLRHASVVLWLLEAEALLLIGVWTKDVCLPPARMLVALLGLRPDDQRGRGAHLR